MKEPTGWVAIHRSICENDLWFLEPFTKAQAWIDLVLNANHREGVINIRGNIVTIKRSQLGWSEVTMASRWRWSRNKVRRYLKWLETKQQIEQQKLVKLTSIITIINYDKYQVEQQTIQQTIQQKDNRRYINNNGNNVNKNIPKGMDTSIPLKENSVNLLQNALKERYPIPLIGITDRKRLYNLIQVLSPRKSTDEWMDISWKKNFISFMNTYLESTEEKYYARGVDSLKEKAKLWREYRGKLN